MVKGHSTFTGLVQKLISMIGMMCVIFAPSLVTISVPKIGVVLIGPLLGCGGDGYGEALLARGNSLPMISFFSEGGLR